VITTVLTVGPLAEDAFEPFANAFTGNRIHAKALNETDVVTSWNDALVKLQAISGKSTITKYTVTGFSTKRVMIPRLDLPWGVSMWFGTSGDCSQLPHESWLFWNAPRWVNTDKPSQTWTP
jgi:hypothetical protein